MPENEHVPTARQMLGPLQERFEAEGFPLTQFIANGEEAIDKDGIGLSIPLDSGPNGEGVHATVKLGDKDRVLVWKYGELGPFVMKLVDVNRILQPPESGQTGS